MATGPAVYRLICDNSSMRFIPAIVLLSITAGALLGQTPAIADQIAATTLAAPEDRRADATVLGYNPEGKLVTLRKGTNDLICLADSPREEGFDRKRWTRDGCRCRVNRARCTC